MEVYTWQEFPVIYVELNLPELIQIHHYHLQVLNLRLTPVSGFNRSVKVGRFGVRFSQPGDPGRGTINELISRDAGQAHARRSHWFPQFINVDACFRQ